MSDRMGVISRAKRRVRLDARADSLGVGVPPTSDWGYPKGYPQSLLAHDKNSKSKITNKDTVTQSSVIN